MTRLSKAALRIAREEAKDRPDVRRKTQALFREAETIQRPADAWRRLSDKQRRSLIAYLADDAEEYPEHRAANVVCLAMLLRAENGGRTP